MVSLGSIEYALYPYPVLIFLHRKLPPRRHEFIHDVRKVGI